MLGAQVRRTAVALGAIAVTAALTQTGLGAFGGDDSVPTPRISSAPFKRTISTSATVAFDGRPGLAHACAVDGRPAIRCTSPVTFRGLRLGAHRFVVRASRGSDVSASASYRWSRVRPRPGSLYATRRTTTANGRPIRPVLTTAPIRPWISLSATFAWVAKRGNRIECRLDRGAWRRCVTLVTYRPLRLGAHEFAVRAVLSSGRPSTANHFRWTIAGGVVEEEPLEAPVLRGVPVGITPATSATISIDTTDGRPLPPGTSYVCKLDNGAWTVCTSPVQLIGLTPGRHQFCVRIERPPLAGPETCASWTVSSGAPPPEPLPPGPGPVALTISGSGSTPLAPGTSAPLSLTLTNPNAVDVRVTALTVAIGAVTSAPTCSGTANFSVTQSTLATSPLGIVVPAGTAVSLPSVGPVAPLVAMAQLATNQDACKGATITLLLTAMGSKP